MDKQKSNVNNFDTLSKYKGLIFDLDETIVKLNVDWKNLKKELSDIVYKEKGIQISFTPLDPILLTLKKRFGASFFNSLVTQISRYEMDDSRYRYNDDLISYIQKMTAQKFAIYSMNTTKCIQYIVQKYLHRKLDFFISKETCSKPKPTGEDIKGILKFWNFNASEVAFVGNNDFDAQSGHLAQVDTYIIKW
jgi:phosphoglycolate phosphatase-like HAD superfamily hydrolase